MTSPLKLASLLLLLLLTGCVDDAIAKNTQDAPATTPSEESKPASAERLDLGLTLDQFDKRMTKQLKPYEISLLRGETQESADEATSTGFFGSYPGIEFTITSVNKSGNVEIINITSELGRNDMALDLMALLVVIEQTAVLLEPKLSPDKIKSEITGKLMDGDMNVEIYEKTIEYNGIEYSYEFVPKTGWAVFVASPA